jgi:transcription antitermination factor NusG
MFWYPAQVKYQTEKKIKSYLEKREIECFIPFRDNKPLIPCLIFVHTDYQTAFALPVESGYSISYIHDPNTQFKIVPDKQMRDFMLLLNFADTTIKIENIQTDRKWERVRVTKGEFAGIEGELIRIKGHKRVVVRMEGLFSLATSYIPKEYIEKIRN